MTEFVKNDVRLFLLVENIATETEEIIYSTEMFFFDGGLVSIWHWNRKEGFRYAENKHDAPVAVRMEDNDADGIIDRVVYSRDDASEDFFSKSTNTFFRHERLGMIPIVDTIQDSDGVIYQIDAGSETVLEIKGCEQETR